MNPKYKVLLVFGTRPEGIKLAPLIRELENRPEFEPIVCITGQHRGMLAQVMSVFGIKADYDLDLMRDNQSLTYITTRILNDMERLMDEVSPDITILQGDTTTAMAASLAAFYAQRPLAHVEAGLRTGDRYNPFPEEMNRTIIDSLADLCFAPTEASRENLLNEGIESERVFVTGNTVIDALKHTVSEINIAEEASNDKPAAGLPSQLLRVLSEPGRRMLLVTTHRRESFGRDLEAICSALNEIALRNDQIDIVYPVHPNPNVRDMVTAKLNDTDRVHLLEPPEYRDMVWLLNRSYLVLTDSGGIQEEAPSLNKPVLIMRRTTERPEGVEAGVALLVGVEADGIVDATERLLNNEAEYNLMRSGENPYGDGRASIRIADHLKTWLSRRP